jgi:hypothetical protein
MNLYHPEKKPVAVSRSDIIVFVVLLLEAKQIHASAANKKFVSSAKKHFFTFFWQVYIYRKSNILILLARKDL